MSAKRPESQRFWEKVEITTSEEDCWPWTASVTSNGYGYWNRATVGERNCGAHRFAYMELRGPIPEGLTVDHLCRVKLCQNPWHMELVSLEENGRRGDTARLRAAWEWTDDMLPVAVS